MQLITVDLSFSEQQSGFVASLPYLVQWICTNIQGFIADTLRAKRIINTTQTRKIFNTIGKLSSLFEIWILLLIDCTYTSTTTNTNNDLTNMIFVYNSDNVVTRFLDLASIRGHVSYPSQAIATEDC